KVFNRGIVSDKKFNRNNWCYLSLATDTNGFSIVSAVSHVKPTSGTFIRSRVQWSQEEYIEKPKPSNKYNREATGKWTIHLELPFSRYYMPEKLAPRAEDTYRHVNRRAQGEANKAAARVRVWNGMVVIEDIEINGKPIRTFIEAQKDIKP
ncbi:MAG: hypothetical protein WCJ02_08625, partial [bacterium]